MDHLDLRRRREERSKSRRAPESPSSKLARNPYVLLGAGFALGASAPGVFRYMFYPVDTFFLLLAVLAVVAAVICYAGWLLLRRAPEPLGPRAGSEKQLLMAIQDVGAITPVEAALETSLTVDEAEELLTRLADRGHLLVESRNGALFYTLPGRRTPQPRTL